MKVHLYSYSFMFYTNGFALQSNLCGYCILYRYLYVRVWRACNGESLIKMPRGKTA